MFFLWLTGFSSGCRANLYVAVVQMFNKHHACIPMLFLSLSLSLSLCLSLHRDHVDIHTYYLISYTTPLHTHIHSLCLSLSFSLSLCLSLSCSHTRPVRLAANSERPAWNATMSNHSPTHLILCCTITVTSWFSSVHSKWRMQAASLYQMAGIGIDFSVV